MLVIPLMNHLRRGMIRVVGRPGLTNLGANRGSTLVRFTSTDQPEAGVRPRTQEEIGDWVKKELEKFGPQTYSSYHAYHPRTDKVFFHSMMFFYVVFFIFTPYFLYYIDDFGMQDWAQREAFLVIREREAKGIIPISKDLIDPEKVALPTDDELGDTEIII